LKPQALLRELVWTILPLGEGVVCDPFMGSGSTLAAAEALGYRSIGVEKYESYYHLASNAITPLSRVAVERDQIDLGFVC
jgi:site-specific DNA-methyltransferase (adenine-specific)